MSLVRYNNYPRLVCCVVRIGLWLGAGLCLEDMWVRLLLIGFLKICGLLRIRKVATVVLVVPEL